MMRYGREFRGPDARWRRGAPGRSLSRAWLAEPLEAGSGAYDRLYGGIRGARYGDRYDLGYVPVSEVNPLARRLWRGYPGPAQGLRRGAPRSRWDW